MKSEQKPASDTHKHSATPHWHLPPSNNDIAEIAQTALREFPQPFADLVKPVSVHAADFADEETLEALFIEDPYELTGLHSGVAMSLDAIITRATIPPVVWLYRLPILREWCRRGDLSLRTLVTRILVHELGHHFGWSDKQMQTISSDADFSL